VLHLSPTLERASLAVAIATVAHELAHVALEHDLYTQPGDYQEQEDETWRLVDEWGFGAEITSHRISMARRSAYWD
jgi:hypothetical protein